MFFLGASWTPGQTYKRLGYIFRFDVLRGSIRSCTLDSEHLDVGVNLLFGAALFRGQTNVFGTHALGLKQKV